MATSWDRRDPRARDRERGAALRAWLDHEVRPFSAFWGERLEGTRIRGLADLGQVPTLDEAETAAAGGPGGPALVLSPDERAFQRHADRGELWRAAWELRGGKRGRRDLLYRRYQPVHVHEAGVAKLLAIAYTRTDLDRLHLAGARLAEVLGLTVDDRLVNVVPAGPSVAFWSLYHLGVAARLAAVHPRAGDGVEASLRRGAALLPPTVVAAPADDVPRLLELLGDSPVDVSELRTLVWVGDPPTEAERVATVTQASRLAGREVRVQTVWAPDAARAVWGEPRPAADDPPEATYGLATYPDLEVVEVRDPDRDTPVGEAEGGELVHTSLGWRGTATVRLATGAWVGGLVTSVPCPRTGRTVPRLAPEAVTGAWQPRVVDDRRQTTRVDLRGVAGALRAAGATPPEVRDWWLGAEHGELVLALDTGAGRDLALALVEVVASHTGVTPRLALDPQLAARRPQVAAAGPR